MQTTNRLDAPGAALRKNVWDLLTNPSGAILEVGERRKARLISGLAALLLVANLVGLPGSLAAYQGRITSSVLLLASLAGFASIAYAVSRTRHYMAAGHIVITSLFGLGFAGILLGRDPVLSGLFYAPLAFLIAAGILGWRGLALLTGLNILILMLLPLITPAVSWQLAGTLSGEYLTAGVLSLVVARARDSIERSRLTELREANRKLQEMGASLEQRVEARTREISLAAEVGQRINRVRDGEAMLGEAVELIAARFDLYYTQIYLLDGRGSSLILRAGSGDAGRALKRRAHRLPVDRRSICGTAVVEQRVVTVHDTRSAGIFKSNALLPETRSEMAIPLVAGDRVLGVLDLQSRTPGGLQEENMAAYETLAGQLTTALVNLDLFEQVQRSLKEVESYSRRAIQQGWDAYLDGIAMPEHLACRFEAGQVQTFDHPLPAATDANALRQPIRVGGVDVGVFQLSADRPWPEDAQALVETVAAQVAQQVENLRLLEQAGRYQHQAQEALQRLTGEGWQKHAAQTGGSQSAFVYKDGRVLPLQEEVADEHLRAEIRVQNAVIGALGVAGRDSLTRDEQELVAVIAEQLGAHLENIRLVTVAQTELAERQQTELALRESEASLSEAMQISRMGSWVYDPQSETIWLSREHQAMLGSAADEAGVHMPLSEFLGLFVFEADRSGFIEHLANAADGEEWTFRALSAEGDPRILSLTTRRRPGEQERVLGTAQDVTEARKSQELIARRAEELARVAQVATTVSTIQNPDEMLQTVVDLVQEHFALYHAHIYLMDEHAGVLALARGAGDVGRRMAQEGRQIPLDAAQSIVARAARSRRGLIVNRVRQEPDFLPHPLLPDTRSEMAVPMIAGDRLVGILDVQDADPDRFSAEDVNILTTLAAQVAVSLQNARSYIRAQRQAEREALINTISERIQSTSSVEAALQVAVREIGRALGARHTAVRLGVDHRPEDGGA